MRKCVVLNGLDLTSKKSDILSKFTSEYLRVLNLTLDKLPQAKSSNELHHLTYSNIRQTSFLPSDIIQEARKDAWATRKKIKNKFKSCSLRLNKRWFRFVKTKRGNPCFKITYSPQRGFVIPIKKDRQFQRFYSFFNNGWVFENISLLRSGKIAVILEKEFPKPETNQRYVVGLDVGSSTLASVTVFDTKTSKVVKQLYFGKDVAERQRRYLKRRAKLQSLAEKGFERAKKSLGRLKHKQASFVKTRSGQIAKEIVNLAKSYNACISIEKLKDLRSKKGQFNRSANQKINRIPYGKFREFLKSNCEMFQTPLHEVDAYHTSKWCPHCGAVNDGHTGGNYALYKCKECSLIVNSDRKASLAVTIKSVLERNRHINGMGPFQFSNTRVPVNGLLRPDEVGLSNVAVQHINQLMESTQQSEL